MRVFVLLFNAGTDNEGIHTINLGMSQNGTPIQRNLVLMFEEEDDALRYALLLEAQDLPTPSVEAIDQEEVEDICRSLGYDTFLIPSNFVPQTEFERLLLVPPERNLNYAVEEHPEIEAEESEMSSSELDRIRRQLEGLL